MLRKTSTLLKKSRATSMRAFTPPGYPPPWKAAATSGTALRVPGYSAMRSRKGAPSVPRIPIRGTTDYMPAGRMGAAMEKYAALAMGGRPLRISPQEASFLGGPRTMTEIGYERQPFGSFRAGQMPVEEPPAPGYIPSGGQAPAAPPELPPLHKVSWKEGKFDLEHARAPEWWSPLTPSNQADMKRPDVAFLAMLNASIPYLSPEDQMNAATQLYAIDANHFAAYKPEKLKPHEKRVITQATALLSDEYKRDPTQFTVMTPEMRRYYQSSERAEGFTSMLNQLREQTGIPRKYVAGTGMPYTWLQQVSGTLMRQGGEAGVGQTRAQYMSMLGALDPLLAQGKAPEIGGALGIGQMFARPFFSPRPLWPRTEAYGKVRFGQANPLLYA